MESQAQLIYKSYMTYFQPFLPVYFYGMPNGKVYCVYARFPENKQEGPELEFVFAQHDDFSYDYKSKKLACGYEKIDREDFIEWVDKPDQRIIILKVNNNLSSYMEAQAFLNQQAQKMAASPEPEPV